MHGRGRRKCIADHGRKLVARRAAKGASDEAKYLTDFADQARGAASVSSSVRRTLGGVSTTVAVAGGHRGELFSGGWFWHSFDRLHDADHDQAPAQIEHDRLPPCGWAGLNGVAVLRGYVVRPWAKPTRAAGQQPRPGGRSTTPPREVVSSTGVSGSCRQSLRRNIGNCLAENRTRSTATVTEFSRGRPGDTARRQHSSPPNDQPVT